MSESTVLTDFGGVRCEIMYVHCFHLITNFGDDKFIGVIHKNIHMAGRGLAKFGQKQTRGRGL